MADFLQYNLCDAFGCNTAYGVFWNENAAFKEMEAEQQDLYEACNRHYFDIFGMAPDFNCKWNNKSELK